MGDIAFQVLDIFLLLIAVITAVAVIEVRSLFGATMLSGFYSLIMALIWQNMDAVDVSFTEASVGAGISTILLLGALVVVGRDEKPRKGPRIHWPALLICTLCGMLMAYATLGGPDDHPGFGDPEAPIHTHSTYRYPTQTVGKSTWGEGMREVRRGEGSKFTDSHAPGDTTASVKGPKISLAGGLDDAEMAAIGKAIAEHEATHHGQSGAGLHDDWNHHVNNTVTSLLAGYRSFDTMMETAVIFTAGMGLVMLLRRRRDDEAEASA